MWQRPLALKRTGTYAGEHHFLNFRSLEGRPL
jgi:hypothetical protein